MFEKDENNIYSFRVTDPNKKAICVDIYKFFSNGRKSCKIRIGYATFYAGQKEIKICSAAKAKESIGSIEVTLPAGKN